MGKNRVGKGEGETKGGMAFRDATANHAHDTPNVQRATLRDGWLGNHIGSGADPAHDGNAAKYPAAKKWG